jgi:putative membrane protein
MESSGVGFKVFICLFSVFLFKSVALADYREYCLWRMGPGMMGWGTMGWFGPIFMIVFWAMIIALVVLIIRRLLSSTQERPGGSLGESALDILKKRYARGEINRQEFEEMKKDLL